LDFIAGNELLARGTKPGHERFACAIKVGKVLVDFVDLSLDFLTTGGLWF
jgi:hypothetical protein